MLDDRFTGVGIASVEINEPFIESSCVSGIWHCQIVLFTTFVSISLSESEQQIGSHWLRISTRTPASEPVFGWLSLSQIDVPSRKGRFVAQLWYYKKDGTKHGPVTSQQLKQLAVSGELRPSDSVCRDGRDEWKPAKAVNGLFAVKSSPAASISTDVAPAATHETTEADTAFGRARSLVSRLGSAAKSAAIITAKQAEQAKIQNVSLPSAYAALGREVYAAGSLRDELNDLFKEIDELEIKIIDIEGRSKTRPQGEGFTEKAKSVGAAASDKAEAQAQRLRLSRLMAKLGQAAHELHGTGCGSSEVVGGVEKLLNRTKQLQSEIDEISQKRGSTDRDSGRSSMFPSWIYSWPVVLMSFIVFPIGWALIWTHPRWKTLQKVLWTGASLLFIAAFLNPSTNEQTNSVPGSSVSDYSLEGGITHVPGTNKSAGTSGLRKLAKPYDNAYLLMLEASGSRAVESSQLQYLVLVNGQNAVAGRIVNGEFKPEDGFQITQASKQEFSEIDGRQIPTETPLIVVKDIFNVDDALAVQTWKKIVIYEFSNRSEARYSERTRMTDRTGRVTNQSPVISDDETKWSGSFERIK